MKSATALAHPNIAFVKYWGDRDPKLHIPYSGSLSMNLDGLFTRTTVRFDPALEFDRLDINQRRSTGAAFTRVAAMLDRVREMADLRLHAAVASENNFPTGAGIASSASAFAALALAASAAAGLELDGIQLSRLARTGSGSACRSIPGGFVEWKAGENDEDSYAESIAPPEHWDLTDCIAVVSQAHKSTGSAKGHTLAASSPLHASRIAAVPALIVACRQAIHERDFTKLAQVGELDCLQMHAVMMTSTPPLLYWQPATLTILHAVRAWRQDGLPVFFTIDAGPNVHVICAASDAPDVIRRLQNLAGVEQVLQAGCGGPARLEFC